MRRHVVAAIAGAIVLGLAGSAHGVRFDFERADQLDEWEVLTDRGGPVWTVEGGVLKITGEHGTYAAVRVIRDLRMLEGSISFRFRYEDLPMRNSAEIGAVFRIQPEPRPDGYPGQYVFIDTGKLSVWWHARRLWAWDAALAEVPEAPADGGGDWGEMMGGGGWGVALEDLPDRMPNKWIRVRIDVDREGWHEVYIDVGGGLERMISADEVLDLSVWTEEAWQVDRAELRKPGVLGAIPRRPVREITKTGDPMFRIGSVGIYVWMNRPDAREVIEFDDFEVRGALAVPEETLLATTWGDIRSSRR